MYLNLKPVELLGRVTEADFQPEPWLPLLDHDAAVANVEAVDTTSRAPMVPPYMLYWNVTDEGDGQPVPSKTSSNTSPWTRGELASA